MREVQIVKWCDACWLESQQHDGGSSPMTPATDVWTVGVVEGESTRPALKVLDLCEAHAKPLADLATLLTQVGQTPDPEAIARAAKEAKAAKAARPVVAQTSDRRAVPCPVCRRMVAPNVLVAHIWIHHREDKQPPQPVHCPECGQHYPSGQGMSSHRRLAHDFDAVEFALSGVKDFKRKTTKAKSIAPPQQPELTAGAE